MDKKVLRCSICSSSTEAGATVELPKKWADYLLSKNAYLCFECIKELEKAKREKEKHNG